MTKLTSIVLGFAALVSATASTYTQEKCVTNYGTCSHSSLSTTTWAKTFTFTVPSTSTYTPSSTTTPAVSTTTSTVFTTTSLTTTLPTTSTTISTTTTVFTTVTSTTTMSFQSTTTQTVTTTAPVTTTTIGSTSAGFTPIQSSFASKGYTPAKRNALAIPSNPVIAAAELGERAAKTTCHISIGHDGKPTASPAHYPTQVSCLAFVEIVSTSTKIKTASTVITITAMTPISTVTSTSTISVTSTVTPNVVSVTETITYTSTISTTAAVSTTSTTTVSTTSTVYQPQATVYGVCQQNNYLNTLNGEEIDAFDEYGSYSQVQGVSSIGDCCNRCIAMGSGCAVGIYLASSSTCFFVQQGDGSCSATKNAAKLYLNQYTNGNKYEIFNTNCGNFAGP